MLRATVVRRLAAAGCVFAEDEADLLVAQAASDAELHRMTVLREMGRPLELVVGWAEFCGLRVAVADGVFVPRRRTELLVEVAHRLSPDAQVLVELCCGTGAVSMALARHGIREVHVVDVDADAVRCAEANLSGTGAACYAGDLFGPLPPHLRGRVEMLVASPPYVPTDAITALPAEARLHEPRVALDGGRDGLTVHRRIARAAASWIAPTGHVLLETSAGQGEPLAGVWDDEGWAAGVHRREETDSTVVVAARDARQLHTGKAYVVTGE